MSMQTISIEELTTALQRLPQAQRKLALLFIDFLEHVTIEQVNANTEDDLLWTTVLAHIKYRGSHPDEQPEVFDTPEAFLRANEKRH